MKKFIDT